MSIDVQSLFLGLALGGIIFLAVWLTQPHRQDSYQIVSFHDFKIDVIDESHRHILLRNERTGQCFLVDSASASGKAGDLTIVPWPECYLLTDVKKEVRYDN